MFASLRFCVFSYLVHLVISLLDLKPLCSVFFFILNDGSKADL